MTDINFPSRRDWSPLEVNATVEAYFKMLLLELEGKHYNKTEYRHNLQNLLDNRTDPAIERKHQNISAILTELELPCIDGYKPLGNYQALLRETVEEKIKRTPELFARLAKVIEQPVRTPSVDDILSSIVDPPSSRGKSSPLYGRERPVGGHQAKVNFLLKEASNAALGLAGEEYVFNFERARLLAGRKDALAAKIEHVSQTRGDYEGYDILSFEATGRERLIEVKTTGFNRYTPFYVTSNELSVSIKERETYHLYRVFDFRKQPRLFSLKGSLEQSFSLEPTQYRAHIR